MSIDHTTSVIYGFCISQDECEDIVKGILKTKKKMLESEIDGDSITQFLESLPIEAEFGGNAWSGEPSYYMFYDSRTSISDAGFKEIEVLRKPKDKEMRKNLRKIAKMFGKRCSLVLEHSIF